MFYFLLIVGAGLMSFGLHIRKNEATSAIFLEEEQFFNPVHKETPAVESMSMPENEMLLDLRHRMEELEGTLFESLMNWQMERKGLLERLEGKTLYALEEEDVTAVAEETEVTDIPDASVKTPEKKPMPDNIRTVVDYEDQGLSVQEIANITRMKKGEVLLLRSLSKHYTK